VFTTNVCALTNNAFHGTFHGDYVLSGLSDPFDSDYPFGNFKLFFDKTDQINVIENREGNQELIIQTHWQHRVHKTHDKGKQNITQHNTNEKHGPHQ
jgi:hypothetical protein